MMAKSKYYPILMIRFISIYYIILSKFNKYVIHTFIYYKFLIILIIDLYSQILLF